MIKGVPEELFDEGEMREVIRVGIMPDDTIASRILCAAPHELVEVMASLALAASEVIRQMTGCHQTAALGSLQFTLMDRINKEDWMNTDEDGPCPSTPNDKMH